MMGQYKKKVPILFCVFDKYEDWKIIQKKISPTQPGYSSICL